MDWQRILTALVYGAGAASAAYNLKPPSSPGEWVNVILAGVIAGWGKYSSSTTLLFPNREVWTAEQRQDAAK